MFFAVICEPPCENGACVDNNTCTCSDGYIGPTCSELGNCSWQEIPYLIIILLSHSTVVNSCDVNPCKNGGSCSLIGQNYVCDCVSGFRGSFCQNKSPGSLVGKSKFFTYTLSKDNTLKAKDHVCALYIARGTIYS